MGCAPTLEQTVGAAPSVLSQLTRLQRRISLLFSFVQTRGQRTWQLTGQSQGVLEPAKKGSKGNSSPLVVTVAPKEASKYAPSRCLQRAVTLQLPPAAPQNMDNNTWGAITQGQDDADVATLGSLRHVPESLGSLPLPWYV